MKGLMLEYMILKRRLDATAPLSSLISSVKCKFLTSTPMQMSIFGAMTLLFMCMLFQMISNARATPKSRKALYEALLKLVFPTRSIWPTHYYRVLAQSSQNARNTPVTFSSIDLVGDIIRGDLEFRNPAQDLVDIVKGRVGSNMVFTPGPSQQAKTLYWILRNEISSILGRRKGLNRTHIEMPNLTLRDRILKHAHRISIGNAGPVSPRKMVTSSFIPSEDNLSRQNKDIASLHLTLDSIHRSKIPEFIKHAKKTVYSGTHSEALIELSTFDRPCSVFDDSISHVSLPFLGNHSNLGITPTFLFLRLPALISSLTSGTTAVTIIAVQNISTHRAAALDAYVRILDEESTVRQKFIGVKGLSSWREEKLYAQWEAALYRANLLSRWIISFKHAHDK